MARQRGNPYSGHDPANTRRFAGLIWVLFGVVSLGLLPLAQDGVAAVAAGVVMAAAAIAAGVALLRNRPIGYNAMLALSYVGVLALAGLQALAGPDARIYQELYLVLALHTASVHPPRRTLAFMAVLVPASVVGQGWHGWSALAAGDMMAHLVIWSLVCVISSQLVKELRDQRLSARRGEAEAHHLARTDVLTGLGNRRRLMWDLDAFLEQAPADAQAQLVLLDLDGFKAYNDAFGHPAGDELLRRLGAALDDRMRGRATAYRMGGDEFCVLAPDTDAGIVADAVAALSEHGEGFTIGASYGAILLPQEAASTHAALGLADRRMYARKNAGRSSAGRQSTDVLIRLLEERDPDLGQHVQGVAATCGRVAERVAMPEDEIPALLQAAALHDIGKAAIPDAILNKPSGLDDREWDFIRGHTVIGERILLAAPALSRAAVFVRSSHERYDGAGYPDGLSGHAIPLGARIIAVCDAYEAMTAERAYRRAMSPELALEELRRGAGTQFDPAVVEALCAVVGEGPVPARVAS